MSYARQMLDACIAVCRSCGDECARHAQMHAHCRVCTGACGAASRPAGELVERAR